MFLVLLLTFNASTISINDSVAAQYYDNNSLGSLRDILCSENITSETSQNDQDKFGTLDDDNNSSSDGKGSSSSDSKPSGKTSKVITPPPTPASPNKVSSINEDNTNSAGSKGSSSSSSDGKGSASSSAGTEAVASSSSDGKGSSSSDSKPSGKTSKVITPPPAPASPNKIASTSDDSSKSKNTANYDDCFNTEESNEIDNPITNSHFETPESSVSSISCGQVIDESVVLTSNLDCKSDGLLVGGDDISIDLNGFSVTGPSQNSSKIGVMLTNTENVTVQGPGTISDFQAGILSTGGENNSISEIDFSNNHVGVFVTSSTDSTIEDNRLTNNRIGIVAYSSSNSTIDTNLLKSNDLGGTALVDSYNNDIYLNTVKDSLNGIFVDAQSHDNNATFNNLVQDNEIDINNANGLPTNINNNEYNNNNCSVSLPNGLCHGSDLPNVKSNTSELESIDQTEAESPIQNDEESSGLELVGSDNDSSDEQKSIGGGIDDLGSGNNVALQNQDNSGSITAGQGSETGGDSSDSTGSSGDSSDSTGSGTTGSTGSSGDSSDSTGSGGDSSDSTGSGTTGSTGSGTTGSTGSGTTGSTGSGTTGSTGSGTTGSTGSGTTGSTGSGTTGSTGSGTTGSTGSGTTGSTGSGTTGSTGSGTTGSTGSGTTGSTGTTGSGESVNQSIGNLINGTTVEAQTNSSSNL